MSQAHALFDSLGIRSRLPNELLASVTVALAASEEATTVCATGMRSAKDAEELRTAISRDLDCADVTAVTRRILARDTGTGRVLLTAQVEACIIACQESNEECSRHADHHDHCRLCSQATAEALNVCRELLQTLQA